MVNIYFFFAKFYAKLRIIPELTNFFVTFFQKIAFSIFSGESPQSSTITPFTPLFFTILLLFLAQLPKKHYLCAPKLVYQYTRTLKK